MDLCDGVTFPVGPADPLIEPESFSRMRLDWEAVLNSKVGTDSNDKGSFPTLGHTEVCSVQYLPNQIVFKTGELSTCIEALEPCSVLRPFLSVVA
jgi:hypothetical protein